MSETILQQGRFTADGNQKTLKIRSDIDWMNVYNYSVLTAGGAGTGAKFYWQRGMADGTGIIYNKLAADDSITIEALAAPNGFTLVDSTEDNLGNAVATTASTNAVQPVISTGTTTGLVTGSIVRLASVAGAPMICGFDFEIDTVVAATSFRVREAFANAPGVVGGAGTYRVVNVEDQYYPQSRYIVNITQAANAVVHTSVTHTYTVGQKIRIDVPTAFGMVEMDGKLATVTAVTDRTFTTDIDSTAFTAFTFPTILTAFTFAKSVPVGSDTAYQINAGVSVLGGAKENTNYIGMILAPGTGSPAGVNTNVIYWTAGKAFDVDNT